MIYLDSCILIYLLEAQPYIRRGIAEALRQAPPETLCFSPLCKLECLVFPRRNSDAELLRHYEQVFASLKELPISSAIFDEACQLRAVHNLKTPDALHLATAEHHGCTDFWTNDTRLSKINSQIAFRILP